MKILIEFVPIIAFFIGYKISGIFFATAVAIIASFIQVGIHWAKHRRIERMHLFMLILIVFLGGATLLFQDETFIKWKPTVVYWGFALAFLASRFIWHTNMIARLMSNSITLPSATWDRLALGWVAFFFAVGTANLYVAYQYATNTWVNFKLFGILGLTIAFLLLQGAYVARHVVKIKDNCPG